MGSTAVMKSWELAKDSSSAVWDGDGSEDRELVCTASTHICEHHVRHVKEWGNDVVGSCVRDCKGMQTVWCQYSCGCLASLR